MMISPRENFLRIYRRQGMAWPLLGLRFCPAQREHFRSLAGDDISIGDYYDCQHCFATEGLNAGQAFVQEVQGDAWRARYPFALKHDCRFDIWGVAREAGSASAHHMRRMRHPLAHIDSPEQLAAHPWPSVDERTLAAWRQRVEEIHANGRAAAIGMECTIWERAWSLRGMPELMADMMEGDELAEDLLDRITGFSCATARLAARAGVDHIALGDDIGMQQQIMMSMELWRSWLKPRLKQVIDAARSENPDVLIQYHSCGYVEPFIDELIEVGVDILNPVQPECMDPVALHARYGDRLSFSGCLGTQTTLPFGTTQEVRDTVRRYLDLAGDRGGIVVCPTHLVEPEVPWANIEAYIETVRDHATVGS